MDSSQLASIQTITTIVVASANILLVILTAVYVILTGGMVRQMRATRDPSVVVDLEFPETMGRLAISNVGLSPARDIRFAFNDELPWLGSEEKPRGLHAISAVAAGVSFLPPGRTLKYMAGILDWKQLNDAKPLSVAVTFKSEDGRAFRREYVIDVSHYTNLLFESFRDPLVQIANSIKEAENSRRSSEQGSRIGSLFGFESQKRCPMCAELIPKAAKKCSHCGELLAEAGGA